MSGKKKIMFGGLLFPSTHVVKAAAITVSRSNRCHKDVRNIYPILFRFDIISRLKFWQLAGYSKTFEAPETEGSGIIIHSNSIILLYYYSVLFYSYFFFIIKLFFFLFMMN